MFRILVVDDDKNTRRYMQAVLEEAHYTVTTAENGVQALDILGREHIDLIVLDIMMPEMDGYTLTKELRDVQDTIPILMVSAKQLPADKKKGFLVGTDDYMTKPVDEEEMLLRIRALLRRAKIVSEQRIVIGNVVLDYNSMTVTGHGKTQELPQKEFLLLYKLLSYPKKTFSRAQLMDEFWGVDSETSLRAVDVYVTKLRDKLSACDGFKIVTVRGLGYKAVLV